MSSRVSIKTGEYEELKELASIAKGEMLTIKRLLLNGILVDALEKMERLDKIFTNSRLIKADNLDEKEVPIFFAVKYLIYCRIQLSKKIKSVKADLGMDSVSECQENDFNNTIGTSDAFDVVYFCDTAKKYVILSNGTVKEYSQPEILCVIAERTQPGQSENKVYLLFGNLRFPLSPDIIIYFHAQLNAFILKNDDPAQEEVEGIGFSVANHELDVLSMALEELKFDIYEAQSVQITDKEGEEEGGYARSISWGLVEGAGYISSGLVNVASGLNNLMSVATPKLIETIPPESEANVPAGVVIGTEITKNVCNTLANVTGYFATQMSCAVSNLGNTLAPHVKQQSTSLLTYCGMNEESADEYVTGTLEVAGGVMEGFKVLVDGLHKSGSILYSGLTTNTVQLVKHKYGEPMSRVTANTLDSVGSLVTASSNMKSLSPKGLVVKSIKETGKAAALQHYSKDSNPSIGC